MRGRSGILWSGSRIACRVRAWEATLKQTGVGGELAGMAHLKVYAIDDALIQDAGLRLSVDMGPARDGDIVRWSWPCRIVTRESDAVQGWITGIPIIS